MSMNRADRRRSKKLARGGGAERESFVLRNALKFLQNGQLDKAEKAFARVLKVNPSNQDALHFQGVTMYQLGRYDEALSYLEEATHLVPDYAEAQNSLGILFFDLGQLDKAVVCFEKALQLRPNFVSAYVNLGNLLEKRQQLAQAMQSFGKALELDSRVAEASYRLASCLLLSGNPKKAAEVCKACLSYNPYCQTAIGYLYVALKMLKRDAEAIKLYDFDTFLKSVTFNHLDNGVDIDALNSGLLSGKVLSNKVIKSSIVAGKTISSDSILPLFFL